MLTGAIASLLAQTLPAGQIEILIVDNSPDQAQAAAFAARYAGIGHLRYLFEPRTGLSHARNTGLSAVTADIVGFIDDDAIASPGWAAALHEGFAKFGPEVGAVGGPSRPLWLGPRPGWLTDELLGHLSIVDYGPNARLLRAGQMIMGCNMAFDAAVLREIGGFSPQLGRRGAENSLLSNGEPGVLNAIRAAGRSIGYMPAAAVDHGIDPSRLSQTWFRRRAAWQAVSDYLMEPAAVTAHAPAAARYLRLVEASAARPQPVGLFAPIEDGAAFAEDLLLVRELMIATLHGGAEADPALPPSVIALTQLRLRQWLRRSPRLVKAYRAARRTWLGQLG